MNTREILNSAGMHLKSLAGSCFDDLQLSKPKSVEAATNLCKIISKLSPLVGNLIEFNVVDYLNEQNEFSSLGKWKRQDPDFPDALFVGDVTPSPGFEIKAWFPLATEITGRFKDSQNHFREDQTDVALVAWLPEYLIYGRPKIIDVCIVSAQSVAIARDKHYHNPPDYIVIEPEDTSSRTRNLQQSNTNGYKFQSSSDEVRMRSVQHVQDWGDSGKIYDPSPEYQLKLQGLKNAFKYRLDTNFAKMDRIEHNELEQFKTDVLGRLWCGMSILEWAKTLRNGSSSQISEQFMSQLKIN